jgi:integrase
MLDMKSNSTKRRRSRGSAWHWKQTDNWYYTDPASKQRVPLVDEVGKRIRGVEHRKAAELALARVMASRAWLPAPDPAVKDEWLVAKVCSTFIEHCTQRAAAGSLNAEYADGVKRMLNDLCAYCGALPVSQLKLGHFELWLDQHPSWKSPVTRRNAITTVKGAFQYANVNHGVGNPLRGLKKPPHRPRLHSLSPEDEATLYAATDEPFRNFLFAAIHTGLRPFCELAKLRVRDVEQTPRGMLWRIYSSKTKKIRKIPIRREVAELIQPRLLTAKPDDPVFTNAQGNAWNKPAGKSRIFSLKRKLAWDQHPVKKHYSCYTCRHTFAHRLLSGYWNNGKGCSIETLAELMGNTPQVAFQHYGKEWGQHYQDPLWTAMGMPSQKEAKKRKTAK